MENSSDDRPASESQRGFETVELLCPHCHKSPESMEEWLRTDGPAGSASSKRTVQSLFDTDLGSSDGETSTDAGADRMVAFLPCEHSFRYDDLHAVIEHLRVLDDLIQRHDEATTAYERQGVREEIRATGTKLDTAVERCETRMDSTRASRG